MSGNFFYNIPAGIPPVGVTSNFTDPPTLMVPMVLCSSIFLFFMMIMVLIRFYVRIWLTRTVGWDDCMLRLPTNLMHVLISTDFCAAAAVVSCLHSSLLISAIHLGLGTHLWDIRASVLMVENNVRWIDSVSLVYPVTIWLIKISILLLYLRIFQVEKKLRLAIQGSIMCLTLIYTAYVAVQVIQLTQCVSFTALFTYPVCLNVENIAIAQGVANVVTDFWVLLLPMRALLNLQLNRRRKIGLVALFGTGLITCAMSLVRCIQFVTTYAASDNLWTGAQVSQYSVIEVNVAIMAASAPMLPAFLARLRTVLTTRRTINSSSSKTELSGCSSNASSCNKPVRILGHNNTMDLSTKIQDNPDIDQWPKYPQPIIRTDTYEVTSRAWQ